MRIVTWNCCGKFESNYRHLHGLGFDVAVVQECTPLSDSPGVTSFIKNPTSDPRSTKHLGLFARDPWTLTALEVDDMPWLVAATVDGPLPHTILGVWTQGPSVVDHRTSYTAQVGFVVDRLLSGLDGPVVVAGDFNAPGNDADSIRQHRANVAALEAHGLVSVGSGSEVPTYFHQRREPAQFSIDHVFIPKEWNASMQVGSFQDWVATGRSDHVPVLVDVE